VHEQRDRIQIHRLPPWIQPWPARLPQTYSDL